MTYEPKPQKPQPTLFQTAFAKAAAKASSKPKTHRKEVRALAPVNQEQKPQKLHRKITFEAFCKIPSHRIQRPTEFHAKALARFTKTQELARENEVAIARFPDGREEVLDGHTRRHMWITRMLPEPNELEATIYLVKDQAESNRHYQSFNSKESYKTTQDSMVSCARDNGLNLTSATLKNGGHANAIKLAFAFTNGQKSGGKIVLEEAYAALSENIKAVDAIMEGKKASGFMVLGGLVSHIKYGEKALVFLWDVVNDAGAKDSPSDLVFKYKLTHKRGLAGGSNTMAALNFYMRAFKSFYTGKSMRGMKFDVSELRAK